MMKSKENIPYPSAPTSHLSFAILLIFYIIFLFFVKLIKIY